MMVQYAISAFQLPVSSDLYRPVVITSGCVVRTGYFYPNQSRRLKIIAIFL